MEYLKPIETLQQSLKSKERLIYVLIILLGTAILGVPFILKGTPYLIMDNGSLMYLRKAEPWKISVSRVEDFTKSYLSSRFEWTLSDFDSKQKLLQSLVAESVYKKLQETQNSFRLIAQNQNARSYYVFEGFGFSNSARRIEARITRVLRFNQAAIATPLVVRLSYDEASVSESNPYGLLITGIEEKEPSDGDSAAGDSS